MPTWTVDDKMIKKGSYCNWESVLAHARHIFNVDKQLEEKDLDRITEYVFTQMGDTTPSTEAPHFSEIEHFKIEGTKSMNATDYHNACCYQTNEVLGVKINETGHSAEVVMDTNSGKLDFALYIKRPPLVADDTNPSMFQSYKKGKNKEKELCVFYYPGKNGFDLNTQASNLFKMQIYGEVLLVNCTKEASFMPRERYTNYLLTDFHECFERKRKRPQPEQVSMRPEEYNALKAEMQASLTDYEKQASSAALVPSQIARATKMPPPDGKQLAKLARHRQAQAN